MRMNNPPKSLSFSLIHAFFTLLLLCRPCKVKQLNDYLLQITIQEGRNRQIRKMLGALDYKVIELQRVDFCGITLHGLRGAGDWKRLDAKEMKIVRQILQEKEE